MGVRVVKVRRRDRAGWLERTQVPLVTRALRSLGRRIGARADRDASDRPPIARGLPLLVARPDGSPRCVACGLCEAACPTRCIRVLARDGAAEPVAGRFELDPVRCVLCGLCEEACPEQAIVMSARPLAQRPLSLDELLADAGSAAVAPRLALLAAEDEAVAGEGPA